MKKYLFIIIPVLAVIACSFLLFTPLDHKVNDIFLRALPSLTEDDSVLVIKVDDLAIENVGLFPWTRDILADAIVLLRELGAQTLVFDLNYIDNSPAKVDPQYVKEELPAYLNYGFNQINDTVSQVMDAFENRQLGPADAPYYKQAIIDFNEGIKNSLDTSISYVIRDVDTYFGRTLKFFGDSYLTLTMVMPADIIGDDKTFDMSPYDLPWLEKEIAVKNISAERDTKTPNAIGIIPAIPELLTRARGGGFVNAEPDVDGYRRRQYLFYKYNGKYYGQLSLVPLLHSMGDPLVEITNRHITLKDANLRGEVRDIRIPRANDGSIIIKWPKKDFQGYNQMSSWELIGYNRHEAVIVKNLRAMEESGFFSFWENGEPPLDAHGNGEYLKELLFEGEVPEDGITFDTYMAFRTDFLEKTDLFLNGPTEEIILSTLDENDHMVREYVSDYFSITRAQFAELLNMRERTMARTDGAFCIVGVDATSMTDFGLTTFHERFPNVGIYSAVTNMILAEDFLDDVHPWVSIFLALALSVGIGIFTKSLTTKQSIISGLATLAASVLILLLVFIITKRYVGVVTPFASIFVTFLTLSAISFLDTAKEKSFLRSAFSRYLSPQVITEIIADPSKLNLGGEKREMTAIFTDIRGFSTISESLDPADLVKLLNLYLTDMSNIVMEHRGTIDKYEGDAIIAFFGAPIHMEEHAALACRTAIRMKQAEDRLNERITAEGLSPTPLFTRIGINTGDMVVGNMGSSNKMDYTIMGNAVNLAARLEGVNKQYNTKGILISEYTRTQIGNEFLIRSIDKVRVVGVNTPLRLFELLGILSEADAAHKESAALWEQAIKLYENKEFEAALKIFNEVSEKDEEDGVAYTYIDRCEAFLKTPPAAAWDGVFNLTQK